MICSNCGNTAAGGSSTCPSCGAQLAANTPMGAGAAVSAGGYAAQGPETPAQAPAAGYPDRGPETAPSAAYAAPGSGTHGHAGQAFKFDAARWTRNDQIIGGATVVLLVSLFLPWFRETASAPTFVQSQTGDGVAVHPYLWIVFILCLGILGYLIARAGLESMPFHLPLGNEPLLLVGTGINFVLVLIAFLLKPLGSFSTVSFSVSVSWSFGAFVALVAAIVAVVPLAVPALRTRTGR